LGTNSAKSLGVVGALQLIDPCIVDVADSRVKFVQTILQQQDG